MTIVMTMAGVNCDAKVLDNEITCRIPKNMSIPSEGLPVKVGRIPGNVERLSFLVSDRAVSQPGSVETAQIIINLAFSFFLVSGL